MSKPQTPWSFRDATVKSSFFWSLVLTLLPVVSSFVISLAIARTAGATVWGTVSWTMAFATAVLIVAKLGLDLGASRLASEYGVSAPGTLRRLFASAFGLRMIATVVVSVLTILFARQIAMWFDKPDLADAIRIGAAIVVCASVYEFQEQFLIGLNRHETVSRVRSAMLGSRVVLTVVLLIAGAGAVRLLGGYVAAWLVGIVIFALLLRRNLPAPDATSTDRNIRSRLLSISLPLAVGSASVTVYSQMDKLMLGYFDTIEEVGQYAIARAVAEVALFPAFALVMTLRPALASRFSAGNVDECALLIRRSLRLAVAGGVLLASVLALNARGLLSLAYSPEFAYAGGLMGWFALVIVFRSAGALIHPALVAAERTRTYAVLTMISAALNFVLNIILIPRMHAAGAIVATIVSYSVLLVLGLRQVFSIFGVRLDPAALSVGTRTVLAGILSTGITWTLLRQFYPGAEPGGWVVLLWSAGQAMVYIVAIVGLRVVRPADFRSVVPRQSHPLM